MKKISFPDRDLYVSNLIIDLALKRKRPLLCGTGYRLRFTACLLPGTSALCLKLWCILQQLEHPRPRSLQGQGCSEHVGSYVKRARNRSPRPVDILVHSAYYDHLRSNLGTGTRQALKYDFLCLSANAEAGGKRHLSKTEIDYVLERRWSPEVVQKKITQPSNHRMMFYCSQNSPKTSCVARLRDIL